MSNSIVEQVRKKLNGGKPIILLPTDDRNVSDFAAELVAAVSDRNIFLKAGNVVEVMKNGDMERMDPARFCTWVEQYVATCGVHDMKKTMNQQTAVQVLKCPAFHGGLREVTRSLCAGSPAWDADGKLRYVPAGYDPATKTYICGPDDYRDEIKTPEEARKWLTGIYEEFQFTDDGRSRAVALASLLTPYVFLLMDPKVLIPVFAFTANDKKAGKTTICSISCWTNFGEFEPTDWPKGQNATEEANKRIFSAALISKIYVVFDNVDGRVSSGMLANILTSGGKIRGRVLSKSEYAVGDVPIFYFTGNGMEVSTDLRDRFLFCELFIRETHGKKKFNKKLTNSVILSYRRKTLAACWRLVESWVAAGRPAGMECEARYDDWQKVVGGIVQFNGFGNPMEPAKLKNSPASEDDDLELGIAAMDPRRVYNADELLELWEREGLFERRLKGWNDSGDKVQRAVKSWIGRLLGRAEGRIWNGRELIRIPGARGSKTYQAVPEGELLCAMVDGGDAIPPF